MLGKPIVHVLEWFPHADRRGAGGDIPRGASPAGGVVALHIESHHPTLLLYVLSGFRADRKHFGFSPLCALIHSCSPCSLCCSYRAAATPVHILHHRIWQLIFYIVGAVCAVLKICMTAVCYDRIMPLQPLLNESDVLFSRRDDRAGEVFTQLLYKQQQPYPERFRFLKRVKRPSFSARNLGMTA